MPYVAEKVILRREREKEKTALRFGKELQTGHLEREIMALLHVRGAMTVARLAKELDRDITQAMVITIIKKLWKTRRVNTWYGRRNEIFVGLPK
jgi:hypothetical protein